MFSYKLLLAATYALTVFSDVSAGSLPNLFSRSKGGINCDGSSLCAGHGGNLNDILTLTNKYYKSGQTVPAHFQFACHEYGLDEGSGICASLDKDYTIGDSTNGQSNSLADIIEDLIYHGCDPCGTAPTVRTGNDLSQGSVTVNHGSISNFGTPTQFWN